MASEARMQQQRHRTRERGQSELRGVEERREERENVVREKREGEGIEGGLFFLVQVG